MKYRFAEMIWHEIRDAAQQDRVAVLPVATYEDHGPHLPVDVDVVLCTEICERAVNRIPSEAVLAPPVSHGYSPHHMDFHGTLTIDWDVFIRYVKNVCDSLAYHGFQRILIVNGHGSNTSPLDLARQLNRAFVQVAAKVKPSVVVIHVAKQREQAIQLPNFGGPLGPDDPLFRRFFENLPKEFRDQFPQPSPDTPEKPRRDNGNSPFTGSGSGIVVTADGYILTNRHVIENATRLKVITADGREHPARLRGVDTQSDLAVIKIDAKNLRPAQFAEASNVRIGEFAIRQPP